ncbi:hypothetical protein JCM8547_000528 [Rhodosporidiobolus lusitaniae]
MFRMRLNEVFGELLKHDEPDPEWTSELRHKVLVLLTMLEMKEKGEERTEVLLGYLMGAIRGVADVVKGEVGKGPKGEAMKGKVYDVLNDLYMLPQSRMEAV